MKHSQAGHGGMHLLPARAHGERRKNAPGSSGFPLSSWQPYPHSQLVEFIRKPVSKGVELWEVRRQSRLPCGAEAREADRECPAGCFLMFTVLLETFSPCP